MSIRDALRVVALEKHVEELRTELDRLAQRQDELEAAWREAARPRGTAVDRGAPQPMQTNDARKAQGRY